MDMNRQEHNDFVQAVARAGHLPLEATKTPEESILFWVEFLRREEEHLTKQVTDQQAEIERLRAALEHSREEAKALGVIVDHAVSTRDDLLRAITKAEQTGDWIPLLGMTSVERERLAEDDRFRPRRALESEAE